MGLGERIRTRRALATVTGVAFQDILTASSGYAPAITQMAFHNNNGDIRNISIYEQTQRIFTLTLGASGTIIWDMDINEELHAGSGIRGSLDAAGSIDVLVRYVYYDERTPTNLNPATYIPSTTRKPNELGNQ